MTRVHSGPQAAGEREAEARKKKGPHLGFIRFNANGVDLPFVTLVLLLLTIGLVMMFSASYAYAYYHDGDSFYYISKQLIFAVLGVAAMFAISYVDYHVWHRLALPLYAVALLLLVLALFYPARSNVHRWVWFGPINFQPSEIAKLAIILAFAHMAVLFQKRIKTFKYGVLPFAILLIPVVILMVLEPHLSGTILIVAIALIMMFVGGTAFKWFAIGGGLLAGALTVLVLFTDVISYASTRLEVWLDPFSDPRGKGWQTIQSLYAIGSGGLLGQGLGNSRQKHLYISEPQNDFVFAVVCEELGFVGAAIVIILFALLVWRGFVVAMRAPDSFGMLITVGVVSQVGIQAALNIAVVTNTVPNTGISLPFFSYGGTALMMILFQMGLVMSVSRHAAVRRS